jgi:hypothetical protein
MIRSVLQLCIVGAALIGAPGLAAQTAGVPPLPHPDHSAHHPQPDSAFAALQERGRIGMGVDQYESTHRFDALTNGGRIEYLLNSDDPEGITAIRQHLQQITRDFAAGDFTTPGFVHAMVVPGTVTMAARKDRIQYTFRPLPRGGEVNITTADPDALRAIHEFMAFQRQDHRAEGHAH